MNLELNNLCGRGVAYRTFHEVVGDCEQQARQRFVEWPAMEFCILVVRACDAPCDALPHYLGRFIHGS